MARQFSGGAEETTKNSAGKRSNAERKQELSGWEWEEKEARSYTTAGSPTIRLGVKCKWHGARVDGGMARGKEGQFASYPHRRPSSLAPSAGLHDLLEKCWFAGILKHFICRICTIFIELFNYIHSYFSLSSHQIDYFFTRTVEIISLLCTINWLRLEFSNIDLSTTCKSRFKNW